MAFVAEIRQISEKQRMFWYKAMIAGHISVVIEENWFEWLDDKIECVRKDK